MVEIELLATMSSARIDVYQGTELKTGDRLPTFQGQLLDRDGNPYDLTGKTPEFHMHDADGNDIVTGGTMNVLSEADGEVEYEWQAGDTDLAEEHDVEVVVVDDATGKERTFPASGYVTVDINEDLQ